MVLFLFILRVARTENTGITRTIQTSEARRSARPGAELFGPGLACVLALTHDLIMIGHVKGQEGKGRLSSSSEECDFFGFERVEDCD